MSRALMAARCRGAQAIGTATLAGWRFVINPDGFGSIAPQPGGCVHGVLWRLTARDLAAINAYESVELRPLRAPPAGGAMRRRDRRWRWFTSRAARGAGRRGRAISSSWSTPRASGNCLNPTCVRLRAWRRRAGAARAPRARGSSDDPPSSSSAGAFRASGIGPSSKTPRLIMGLPAGSATGAMATSRRCSRDRLRRSVR